MANAVKKKDRTSLILVFIALIATVILLATIAGGLILYNKTNNADINEEVMEHRMDGEDSWEEEELEEEDTSPASVLHLLPTNP